MQNLLLVTALVTLAAGAQSVALGDSAGPVLFDFDDGGHDGYGTTDKHADQYYHASKNGHGGHGVHGEHGEHGINPHIWLDPFNAQIKLGVIADHLGKADPVNAKAYQANADAMRQTLAQLQIDIARELAPFAESEFLVLHDAHIYF